MKKKYSLTPLILSLVFGTSVKAQDAGTPLDPGDNNEGATILRAMGPSDQAVTFSINGRPIAYTISETELKEAQALFQKSLDAAKELGQEEPEAKTRALDCLGALCYRNGEYHKSWSYFEESLALKRNNSVPADIADGCDLLAQVARARFDYNMARKLYEESLTLRKQSFAGDSKELAMSYLNLRNLSYDSCDARKASEAENALRQICDSNQNGGKLLLSMLTAPGGAALPGLLSIASSNVSKQQLKIAEKKAEDEALKTLTSGKVPQHPRPLAENYVIGHRSSSVDSDDGESQRRKLELARELLAAQERERRDQAIEQERNRQQLAEAAEQRRRQFEEDSRRQTAEESTRRLEADQAALQRQREAAGTGTSYFSRY